MNIHFICRGNVLRSLTAETYLKSLNLKNVNVISSGTNVSNDDPIERQYFQNTLGLLARHNINHFAKGYSDQLTQSRMDGQDITVCMNQRVIDEANAMFKLPDSVINWHIIDIGEAHRTKESERELYEEEIFQEISDKVDELVATIQASK